MKRLLALAAVWMLAAPALAYLLRPWLLSADPPLRLGHNPSWEDLATPARLLGDLFLTGYYPVLQWIAYLLVGLAIGRMALSKAAVPFLLLAAGTVVAVIAKWLGIVMMEDWGGRAGAAGADRAIPPTRWRACCRSTWPASTSQARCGGWPPVHRTPAPRWICCTPRGWLPP